MLNSAKYRESYQLYLFSIIIGFVAYGYSLFNFTLNIDGETQNNFHQTLTLGRWGHTLLREYILPEPFIPYFTNLISILFIALTSVALARVITLKGWSAILFCALFITFPQLSYQFEFMNQADTFSIGYFLSAICVLLFFFSMEKDGLEKVFLVLLSVATYTLSISIYQSLITVPVVLFLSRLLVESYSANKSNLYFIKTTCAFILVCVSSIAIYALATNAVRDYFGINSTSYILNYVNSGRSANEYLLSLFSKIIEAASGNSNFGFGSYAVASFFASLTIIKCLAARAGHYIFRIIFVITILFIPFIFLTVNIHGMPGRIFVATALSFAVIIVNEMRFLGNKLLATLFLTLLCLMNIALITKLFYSDHAVREADVLMANRIRTLMLVKFPSYIEEDVPVYFHGGYNNAAKHHIDGSDVFGRSFFFWDGGNNNRITSFFRYYDIAYFKQAKQNDILKVVDNIAPLPKWPNPGSVQMIDGVMVVKLNDDIGWLPFSIK